ncbi:hypothetical protein D3C73_1347630 [compost metagenome]
MGEKNLTRKLLLDAPVRLHDGSPLLGDDPAGGIGQLSCPRSSLRGTGSYQQRNCQLQGEPDVPVISLIYPDRRNDSDIVDFPITPASRQAH